MRVLGYGRAQTQPPGVDRFTCAELGDTVDELLRESDVVVLSARLTAETYHLIGERELRLTRPTAYLINMARGSGVDEATLVGTLYERRIVGAGWIPLRRSCCPPSARYGRSPTP